MHNTWPQAWNALTNKNWNWLRNPKWKLPVFVKIKRRKVKNWFLKWLKMQRSAACIGNWLEYQGIHCVMPCDNCFIEEVILEMLKKFRCLYIIIGQIPPSACKFFTVSIHNPQTRAVLSRTKEWKLYISFGEYVCAVHCLLARPTWKLHRVLCCCMRMVLFCKVNMLALLTWFHAPASVVVFQETLKTYIG